jgi:hypothetical protein
VRLDLRHQLVVARRPHHLAALAVDPLAHPFSSSAVSLRPEYRASAVERGCAGLGGSLAPGLASVVMDDRETRIQLCGPLVVRLEGVRVERSLPGRQGRLLFAYLALGRRRPATRSELTKALWGGDEPDSADAALSALLSKLRRVAARYGSGSRGTRGSTSRRRGRRSTAQRARSRAATGRPPGARRASSST